MEVRSVEEQYKSISIRNWERIPKVALPFFGSRDLTLIQRNFSEDTTRGLGQDAWERFLTGYPQ